MTRSSYRQFRHIHISSDGLHRPWVRRVDATWIGNQGQVTYWDENGQSVTRRLNQPHFSMFEPRRPFLRGDIIDVQIPNAERATLWTNLTQETHKWGRRIKSAFKAAWGELTRED